MNIEITDAEAQLILTGLVKLALAMDDPRDALRRGIVARLITEHAKQKPGPEVKKEVAP